ncbi:hypothetical protein FB45DRAFT_1000550 [Roridomyces roridus]|uniref:Uncharacterized protein n=1 Tax=Roridomyces roridus TaxID=1738132 RepID=A0AAD7C907_9AGAR|nr:hypothetical protein FB45DRAFT_1000550 [Roridomyces roridus]
MASQLSDRAAPSVVLRYSDRLKSKILTSLRPKSHAHSPNLPLYCNTLGGRRRDTSNDGATPGPDGSPPSTFDCFLEGLWPATNIVLYLFLDVFPPGPRLADLSRQPLLLDLQVRRCWIFKTTGWLTKHHQTTDADCSGQSKPVAHDNLMSAHYYTSAGLQPQTYQLLRQFQAPSGGSFLIGLVSTYSTTTSPGQRLLFRPVRDLEAFRKAVHPVEAMKFRKKRRVSVSINQIGTHPAGWISANFW